MNGIEGGAKAQQNQADDQSEKLQGDLELMGNVKEAGAVKWWAKVNYQSIGAVFAIIVIISSAVAAMATTNAHFTHFQEQTKATKELTEKVRGEVTKVITQHGQIEERIKDLEDLPQQVSSIRDKIEDLQREVGRLEGQLEN